MTDKSKEVKLTNPLTRVGGAMSNTFVAFWIATFGASGLTAFTKNLGIQDPAGFILAKEDRKKEVDRLRKQLEALQKRKEGKGGDELFKDWVKDFGSDPFGWFKRNEPVLKARLSVAEKNLENYKTWDDVIEWVIITLWMSFWFGIIFPTVKTILDHRLLRKDFKILRDAHNKLKKENDSLEQKLIKLDEKINDILTKIEKGGNLTDFDRKSIVAVNNGITELTAIATESAVSEALASIDEKQADTQVSRQQNKDK